MEKKPICPKCGKKITESNIMFGHMMAAIDMSPNVLKAIDLLGRASSWDQRREVLEKNPILLTQEAENHLKSQHDVMRSIGIGDDEEGAEQLLGLVKRCREVGIARTFRELGY